MLHDILEDDHTQWHPPLMRHYTNFWPFFLIWTVLPSLTFYLIVWGSHISFATVAVCQQRMLTPPDTWSCPTLGLACVLMSRPISPELVLFPDFWVSNIPRYFCFACIDMLYTKTIYQWIKQNATELTSFCALVKRLMYSRYCAMSFVSQIKNTNTWLNLSQFAKLWCFVGSVTLKQQFAYVCI